MMDSNEKIMNEIIEYEKDLTIDILNADLNLFINNNFIKDIPVLKSVYGIFNLATTISNAIFMKKLYIFLNNLPKSTPSEKEKFLKKYKKDEVKFAERIFEIIDKMDDSEKCQYEAHLFEKYYYDEIDYQKQQKWCQDTKLANDRYSNLPFIFDVLCYTSLA